MNTLDNTHIFFNVEPVFSLAYVVAFTFKKKSCEWQIQVKGMMRILAAFISADLAFSSSP